MKTIYTIGHSTHSYEDFVEILRCYNIEALADIRNFPGSRKFPHFNKEFLEQNLPDEGVRYLHFKDLGGRRKPNPDSKNGVWRHSAFRGYADYMETDEFKNAVIRLEHTASLAPTVMMCSEAVWWRCHRSMVSDYLKANSWTVIHIMGKTVATEHPYTAPARIADGRLTYETLI